MRAKGFFILISLLVFALSPQAWPSSQSPNLQSDEWISVRKAVIDELTKRRGAYSTPQEDTANWKFTEEEKSREDDAYRENVDKARLSFIGARNTRDGLAAQVQSLSTDSDDTLQQIQTIRTTIANIDNSLIRWNQDLKTHQKSFETWLSTEKQGSTLVDTSKDRGQAEERLNEQIRSFQEKNSNLQKKIDDGRSDRETWTAALQKQESRYEPIRQELDKIRVKMEAAERSLKEA
ncbi:MAG: hypothetical protein C0390_09265, partial [Syntrophus sp. (in: bacteria)]|nr:hypothetical protein [Syntrophus sp. (in: bacteria)]